jgi:glycosyltransferase involved in cell wall biosynthesis
MGKKNQTWSVVIFCYNERGTISRVTEAVQAVLREVSPGENEVIIVDDGSTDGSAEIISRLEKKSKNVTSIRHGRNLGTGYALRDGYSRARFENVCAVPADGQFDPRELIPFRTIGKKQFISFARVKQEGYSPVRRFISLANRLVNGFLLGINLIDVNWVKIYKRAELRKLDLKLHSPLVESEICAKLILRGNQYVQSPSVYHQRTGGKAKGASAKNVTQALMETYELVKTVKNYQNRSPGKETTS